MRRFHFDFYSFFQFFGLDLFLNGLHNPCIVPFRPNFLFESDFHFPLVVCCSHVALDIDFLSVFLNFLI